MKLKEFLVTNREISQIVYGIVLIMLIPLLIAINTISIISRYNEGIDLGLQRQALIISRTVDALISERLDDHEYLNKQLSSLANNNKDILESSLLEATGNSFKVIASNIPEQVGKDFDSYFYRIAWVQPRGDALATDSIRLDTDDQKAFSLANNERYWLASMPIYNEKQEPAALLSLKISSEIVNQLTRENRNSSIKLLLITIFITILFLAAAVHLWDYALLYRRIKDVDQMKDEFISIASHELRTPITGIKGWSAMMVDGTLGVANSEILKGAKIISESANRLASLVEDLLNVSRIEQNRMELMVENISLTEVIESTLAELKVQSDAKGLLLKFSPHASPLPLISIDKEKMKQVLINLIGNSIKYTEKGEVEVISEEKNNGEILEIRIKDTGLGMSAKARESLFQKFYRVKTEKTAKISGTGLGLWITKQLVELMKGKISVDSMENVGTQMTLQFKIYKKPIEK